MKILRVNMDKLETVFEDLPEELSLIGGRGLTSRLLSREMAPETDPLGSEAKLIIAGGPLAGTLAPSFGRVSVGAKSPLTMGIKEANAGGPAAQKLDRLGIRAIVVDGAPSDNELYILKITKDGATLENGSQYAGMKTYALSDALTEKYGKAAIICIGPAGERKYKGASVAFTDKDGHASRHAGRGGVGAVMGAKGVKAMVIDDSGGARPQSADSEAFKAALSSWPDMLKADPQAQGMSRFGTTSGIVVLRGIGSSPSKNYSSEQTEGYENLGGELLEKLNQGRGGKMDGCMPGCLVRCSVIFHDADGNHLTSALEYETLALMGTNIGVANPDDVAGFDRWCDEMGLDTIELGSALGVAASEGRMEMGNADSVRALLKEIEQGTDLGNVLANGVVATCKYLGVKRIPAFKGQAIPAHDPRYTKATGVTYMTSPMGADHTAGITYEKSRSSEGQTARSLVAQIYTVVNDTICYCTLAQIADRKSQTAFFLNLLNAHYGIDHTADDLFKVARETLRMELEFNQKSGFYTDNEPDPEFIRTEPLAPTGTIFDIDPDEIASIWDQLDTIEMG